MKLEQLTRSLIEYFQVDVQNISNYINQAIVMKKQQQQEIKSIQSGVGVTGGQNDFQVVLDNINNIQQSIDFLTNRRAEANQYIEFFKKIFKNSELVDKIKDVIKE